MSTVLLIKANNRSAEQAVSVQLYDSFLESYKEAHPDDTILELDLFKQHLPYLDANLADGLTKVKHGVQLTAEEQKAISIADQYLDQFLNADKVVIAFPLWNMTIPAVLHTYLDYLNRAGKTFRYTPPEDIKDKNDPFASSTGLLPDKKIAILNARGGVYSQEPTAILEMGVNYVKNTFGFYGVKHIETVIVEGHHQFPEQAEEMIKEGIEKAKIIAKNF
ncbi:FMN-dependent NADH-azoreductase [Paenibacillus nasutitermitis]|uniref:FMN dependent NADH:quinone oxidoreductase n=1 Tax=Paenibacillus nasutitermitis TaxID=1652958 RepID=A0A916ZFF7_9BACL|nr:FMN-dependent NADH-azoreductase [Paenibacillus nasutitermitis]GGD93936.1 FMN-dependent NADH-azoreductase 3 [Paenibacillus nasutitermitis]